MSVDGDTAPDVEKFLASHTMDVEDYEMVVSLAAEVARLEAENARKDAALREIYSPPLL